MSAKAIGINLLISILVTILSAVIAGVVFSLMWAWFIMPVFNAPALDVRAAIGVLLVAGFLTHKTDLSTMEDTEKLVKLFIDAIIYPILALLVSVILKIILGV